MPVLLATTLLAGCYSTREVEDGPALDLDAPAGEPDDVPLTDAPPRPDGERAVDAIPLADAGPGCGNGVLDENELCDDGNAEDGDGCVRCQPARCGDGVVRAPFEQCDDGNLSQEDGCTTLCLACGAENQVAGLGGHCSTRHDTLLGYDAASITCGFGYLLVSGVPASQSKVFNAILAGTVGPYFIGIHDGRTEGSFETVTFAPLAFTDWDPGQPDNVNNQDCVALNVSTENWFDYACTTPRKRVCEDDGAWIFAPDGHALRVGWGRATWDEAVAVCATLGGQLASLETETEDALLMAALPRDARIHVWIGADDRLQEGAFTWLSGDPFTVQGFAIGQPDGDGDCLAVSPGLGGWSDVDCTTRRPFACEVRERP